MSITDELREWFKDRAFLGYGYAQLTAIADRIDAEHKKACDDACDNGYEADYLGIEKWLVEHPQVMEHHGWIRLPKDADGVPIHVGDVMEWPDGETFDVIGIGDGVLFYTESERDGPAEWTGAGFTRHHHAPTVEDVLREFAERYLDYEGIPSAGRRGVGEALMDEYASKLRLKEDA